MNTVEVRAAELIGPALDWATFCAIYEGMEPTIHVIEETTVERKPFIKPINFPRAVHLSYSGAYGVEVPWHPSTDWECGGPLIQKFGCDLNCLAPENAWEANCWDSTIPQPDLHICEGTSPLIAACRAIVRAKLGENVQVPAELLR